MRRSVLVCVFALLATLSYAATFTVTNCNDAGAGSLRQAILDSNANPGADLISFNISNTDPGYIATGFNGGYVWSISPDSALPRITDEVTVDGTTQTANQGDANPDGPEVQIEGTDAGAASGLTIGFNDFNQGTGTKVRGLVINRFSSQGIDITGGHQLQVSGCYLGTDPAGRSAGFGNTGSGLSISWPAYGVQVGGTTEADRNVISGNGSNGIVQYGGAYSVSIYGNFIGTTASGEAPLGNGGNGVTIRGGYYGGVGYYDDRYDPALTRNIISGNTGAGIYCDDDARELGIYNNYIGTNRKGT